MINYIGNMLDDIIENMKVESSTPASHYLFNIVEDTTKLKYTNTDIFFLNSTTTISFKEGTSRNPYIIILPVQ